MRPPRKTTFIEILCFLILSSSLAHAQNSFQDITSQAGLSGVSSSTIVFGDYDQDGKVDLVASNRLFRNESKQTVSFRDVTNSLGLSSMKGNPLFADFDNNGKPDILTTTGQIFLQSTNGKFTESSQKLGWAPTQEIHTVSIADFNGDGWVDVITGLHEDRKDINKSFAPRIYLNHRGLRLYDMTSHLGFDQLAAYVRGIAWADFNQDLKPDAYFSNYRLKANYLFEGQRQKLVEKAIKAGVSGVYQPDLYFDSHLNRRYGPHFGHTLGSAWADFNNDGWLDLWVSNLVHKYVGPTANGGYDHRGYLCDDSKIYRNQGPPTFQFVDMRDQSEIPKKPLGDHSVFRGDELWSHVTVADFDNDGWLDAYVPQVYNLPYAQSQLFRNLGEFKFKDIAEQEGLRVWDTYAASWADLDNDGKMDLVVSGRPAVNQEPQMKVFRNVIQNGNYFLKIRLQGNRSGQTPITAQVRVIHEKGIFLRQLEGSTGSLNQQNDPVLHFGLGKVSTIQAVEIRWPSGIRQVLRNVKPNQTLTVKETP